MAIIYRKKISEVRMQQSVIDKEHLPIQNNVPKDVRYVKKENVFYMFSGFEWQEIELIIG